MEFSGVRYRSTYTATGTAVSGQYSNLGTVTGAGNVSNTAVTHSNPDFYFGLDPAVHIVRSEERRVGNRSKWMQVPAGSTVKWTYIVTNTGNEPLKNVSVVDDRIGELSAASGD